MLHARTRHDDDLSPEDALPDLDALLIDAVRRMAMGDCRPMLEVPGERAVSSKPHECKGGQTDERSTAREPDDGHENDAGTRKPRAENPASQPVQGHGARIQLVIDSVRYRLRLARVARHEDH